MVTQLSLSRALKIKLDSNAQQLSTVALKCRDAKLRGRRGGDYFDWEADAVRTNSLFGHN